MSNLLNLFLLRNTNKINHKKKIYKGSPTVIFFLTRWTTVDRHKRSSYTQWSLIKNKKIGRNGIFCGANRFFDPKKNFLDCQNFF